MLMINLQNHKLQKISNDLYYEKKFVTSSKIGSKKQGPALSAEVRDIMEIKQELKFWIIIKLIFLKIIADFLMYRIFDACSLMFIPMRQIAANAAYVQYILALLY